MQLPGETEYRKMLEDHRRQREDTIGWSPEATAFAAMAAALAILLLLYWLLSITIAGPPRHEDFPPLEDRCTAGMPCVEVLTQ